MYSKAFVSVKWDPQISQPFAINQGVGQGSLLSTAHYELINNDLLHMYDELGLGIHSGLHRCGAPICCDYVVMLGNKVFH